MRPSIGKNTYVSVADKSRKSDIGRVTESFESHTTWWFANCLNGRGIEWHIMRSYFSPLTRPHTCRLYFAQHRRPALGRSRNAHDQASPAELAAAAAARVVVSATHRRYRHHYSAAVTSCCCCCSSLHHSTRHHAFAQPINAHLSTHSHASQTNAAHAFHCTHKSNSHANLSIYTHTHTHNSHTHERNSSRTTHLCVCNRYAHLSSNITQRFTRNLRILLVQSIIPSSSFFLPTPHLSFLASARRRRHRHS